MPVNTNEHTTTSLLSPLPLPLRRNYADSDIYPYDTNRLLLAKPIHGNDYINASWISEPVFPLPSQLPNLPNNQHPLDQQPWIAAQVSQIKKKENRGDT